MSTVLMIPRAPSKHIHRTTPYLWRLWLERQHGASPHLARDLWRLFATVARAEQLYLLRQADRPNGPIAPMVNAISPAMLFALTLRLAPENGRPRAREVVALEESIVRSCTKDGDWY